ncbi:glycosyl transferase family 1 [Candidatus Viridilinea mediisalina]|uniref:Glycosyl transferase family 1 n=1 Tax=Candidatus Viridilinea mediisalina TaxID=2024553 RepID=A0A2A6RMA2_9CHLR|nr:glycosyl transferase family 1 [Candidatus Viridilinea mediisalina]PDW04063.1 hypothetical protein CJ255_05690 [Candidatus Viridilinea mediisalina]
MRLLIISHDTIGTRMAGPGIRYWELARALASELDVTLVAPHKIDLTAPKVATGTYQWGQAATLAPWLQQTDAILANAYVLEAHPELAQASARRIIDLYDPTMLENIELLREAPQVQRDERLRHDLALFQRQLAAGDHFLCATERQRDLYLGALLASGRVDAARVANDPLLRGLIDVLPFGLPAEPAQRTGAGPRQRIPAIGPTAPIILWNGGLWDWMDPLTLIEAMPQVVAHVPDARLLFLAGPHPGAARPQMPQRARARAAALGMLDQTIFFYEEWVSYADRVNFLLDAKVVVSLHRQHLETAYAALRSRILDQLWGGLPGLLSDGDQAANLAREHGFALVAPIEDQAAVAEALIQILTDASQRSRMAQAAHTLAPQFAWSHLAQTVTQLLQLPLPARDDHERQPTMSNPPHPAPAQDDVARIERGQLLHAVRNSALSALEAGWRLDAPPPPAPGRLAGVRHFIQARIIWPLIYPLIARQQEQNAALLRTLYASAEQVDHLGGMANQASQWILGLMRTVDDLQQAMQQRDDQLQGMIEHTNFRIDHLLQGLSELNERTVHERHLIEHTNFRIDHLSQGIGELNECVVRERHLVAQQIQDFVEQLAALEEAEMQIRAMLRGEPAPLPATIKAQEVVE